MIEKILYRLGLDKEYDTSRPTRGERTARDFLLFNNIYVIYETIDNQ